MVALTVLCLGVENFMCAVDAFNMYVFIFLVKFR